MSIIAAFLVECRTYQPPPRVQPETSEIRIVGKIKDGAPPSFEPGEDAAKSYFIVTPAYVLYLDFLQYENQEQRLTIEKLRKIIEGRK